MTKRGGRRCIAAVCSNTNEESLFGFPKDETLKCQWTRQVKRTRAEWPGPTQYNVVCSAHFEEECFEPGPLLRVQTGIDTRCKLVLKKDAVPAKFPRVSVTPSPTALSRTLCCATPTTSGAPVEDTAHTPFSHDPEGHMSRERGGGTRLAAMHYNENVARARARAQATRKDGTKRFSVHYPKYKREGHVVNKILANATYEYAAELMTEVISQCRKAPNERAANDAAPELPRFLFANFDKPNKDAAIVEQVSRFICDGNRTLSVCYAISEYVSTSTMLKVRFMHARKRFWFWVLKYISA